MKENLFGKTLEELTEICNRIGAPGYTAKQIALWMYAKHVYDFGMMTNLSKELRNKLSDIYVIHILSPEEVSISSDGTKKYLFKIAESKYIEAAYIPEKTRATLCVSSQVGCKMRCSFCMTAKQGLRGNLNPAQLLSQFAGIPERDTITNLVFMGMGEPLDNLKSVLKSLQILTADSGYGFSPKRVTVSTIGLIPKMIRFLDESKCHLAISMHSAHHETRVRLLPLENKYPIKQIIKTLRKQEIQKSRRVSFEYIMFQGVNDSLKDVNEISKLLAGLRCRINLIRYHPIPCSDYKGSDENQIKGFKAALENKGFTTTIRASRGLDIDAACGLLSTRKLMNIDSK